MKIQKIGINPNCYNLKSANINKHSDSNRYEQPSYTTSPIGYDLAFQARVDKGLVRFYEVNADKMPKTLKAYIENLADKTMQTPLQAAAAAFAALAGLTTVSEIREAYPDEELFSDLKDAKESKATRGILGTYRENKDLLEIVNRSILASKEDFTVWLVKKIFLESKTIDEINNDFKNEIDKDFRDFYEDKELSENPIRPSTLKALGIKMPDVEFMQSLRFTREGYSDKIGEKISEANRLFWAALPIEERTARAKKSVEKFEKWWNSIPHDQKLEMIANQTDELEMLNDFNSSAAGKTTKNNKYTVKEDKPYTPKVKTGVESQLSRDDLFKIWAKNNLERFKANLTDFDKRRLETKRLQHRIEAWNLMSPEEKTEYINRLRTGSEELRYAFIQAWNENPEILISLSKTLTRDHIEKPSEILYGTEEFNRYMSASMTAFWALHPDYAKKLGDSIKSAHIIIKDAISSGNFEQIKLEIIKNQKARILQTNFKTQNYKAILSDPTYTTYPEYITDFIDTYCNCKDVDISTLPSQYLIDFFRVIYTTIPQENIDSWAKQLRGEELNEKDQTNIKNIKKFETMHTLKLNRAIEATLAFALYDFTGNPALFLLPAEQLQIAMKQVGEGKKTICLNDETINLSMEIPVKQFEINIDELNKTYKDYASPIDSQKQLFAKTIIHRFFDVDADKSHDVKKIKMIVDKLVPYIESYGMSNNIIFSDENTTPIEIKMAFLEKFKGAMPEDLKRCNFKITFDDDEALLKEEEITKIDSIIRKRYSFLPSNILFLYIYELNRILRKESANNIYCIEDSLKIKPQFRTGLGFSYELDRKHTTMENYYYLMSIEQALADCLYEATGEEKLYALTFEELANCLEFARAPKKLPAAIEGIYSSVLDEVFDIKIKKKINTYKLEKLSDEYFYEIQDYLQEVEKENKKTEAQELMLILNPYEEEELIDYYTKKRIDSSFVQY